jgi:hypothetical protein
MDGFLTLPSEGELQDWLVDKVFAGAEEQVRNTVFLGFKYLSVDLFRKRFLITFSTDDNLRAFLEVFGSHGAQGVLWPGSDVKVRAQAMEELTLEIILLDVAPETDEELVKTIMGKYGRVVRCERMLWGGPFSHVKVNKMKVEVVRNKVQLPNVIHSFGTKENIDDFLIWKLQYPGCPRYCFLCGDARHEARQCGQRGITRSQLEEMRCVVGEEQVVEEEHGVGPKAPKLTYAAVLKDPAFLAKQQQERQEKTDRDRAEQEVRNQKKEDNRKREEENRIRREAKRAEEMQRRQRVAEELEDLNKREKQALQGQQELQQVRLAAAPEGVLPVAAPGQDHVQQPKTPAPLEGTPGGQEGIGQGSVEPRQEVGEVVEPRQEVEEVVVVEKTLKRRADLTSPSTSAGKAKKFASRPEEGDESDEEDTIDDAEEVGSEEVKEGSSHRNGGGYEEEKAAKHKAMEMEKRRLKEREEEKLCSLASCSKPGSQRCTKCKAVSYCSRTCQEKDWKEGHKKRCKEITWEHNKEEYDRYEAERQRVAEEEQQQDDLEEEMLRKEEEERENHPGQY